MIHPPPLSLYIHFPWCVRKCPYCDFNSHPLHQALDQDRYIHALVHDLAHELTRFTPNVPLSSIFLGGGTPSLFDAKSLRWLLIEVEEHVDFADDIEITMEANPGTTEHHDFDSYRSAGINRLSIGVQTFDPLQLKKLGRIHSPDDPGKALQSARQGGFENINIDLMFGLPQQSVEQALIDLDRALELKPEHLSLYQLTLEPNTVFYRYPPQLPDQDLVFEIQAALQAKLESAGYWQYEVSAYALKKEQCRHNLNYWQFGDYIGIGAGAHSKLTIDQTIIRRARKKHPATYIATAGGEAAVAESKQIRRDDILFEYLMNGLRLKNGFNLNTASKRTGHSPLSIRRVLHTHLTGELLEIFGDNIRCTDKGYLFLNNILTDLL
ncbi:MAG: radical SAM family heme chaperone HemW [Arenicellales bacterium]